MKSFLIITLLSISSLTFADTSATSALLKVLPAGTYLGKTDDQSNCRIEVSLLNSQVEINASSRNSHATKTVLENSLYRVGKSGRQMVLFLQSDRVVDPRDNTKYTEDSVRIVAVDNNSINVSVGNLMVNNTDSFEEAVSCTIKL